MENAKLMARHLDDNDLTGIWPTVPPRVGACDGGSEAHEAEAEDSARQHCQDHQMSGPPSAILVAMTDEEIIALFLSAVAALKIDDQGVWSLPAEIEVTTRLARQVQERTEPGTPLGLSSPPRYGSCCGARAFNQSDFSDFDLPVHSCAPSTRERAALFGGSCCQPTPVGVADITGTVEPSERAVLHNGKWVEPRFAPMPAEAVATLPTANTAECPVLTPHPWL